MWQVIYDELRDRNFEIIAVALDTGGRAAVEHHIRPTDLDERPEAARRITGWDESEWGRKAPPQYPCLIDEEHVVAGLYGMINVPSAVWINEEGRIVRPVEVPGFGDDWRYMHRETFELPDDKAARQQTYRHVYVDALRDWAHKGEYSEYALPADEVRRRLQPPGEDDVLAAAHARLGRHLYREGHLEAAKRHLQEAARLSPEKWNYLRQSLSLDPELVGQINVTPEFWEVFDAIGDATFYESADLPGMPR
ncbi:hypothetical protein GBA65_02135 [Rubrobacter marinus]|uniref:Uncharacterized protein n=1 Tax=Rubrobacter marinus TaxID=2653852 RepID=A0A6G8PU56_9ACTN|nr:hypothetical protein GBA65_02135 [Rubrobacter marinus]